MYLSPLPFAPPKNGQHARHTAAPKDSFEFRVCFERRQVKQKKRKETEHTTNRNGDRRYHINGQSIVKLLHIFIYTWMTGAKKAKVKSLWNTFELQYYFNSFRARLCKITLARTHAHALFMCTQCSTHLIDMNVTTLFYLQMFALLCVCRTSVE